ncbi:MAG: CoA transferase [Deltaproteobacteria bacterium]|jgi:crotonobetainyl-CoA:carnitine CoA-transferase CaiB-like acyl-CoA transferase|nr:CoA transferase [Deltaproteobacteria bacterium]
MTQPLEGLLVLDWTIWQQGPICSAMLGDMGARVIKIEQRGTGDPGRWLTGAGGVDTRATPNWYFEANNRNKEAIEIDLKKPEGVEVVLALAEKADVFVQNFRHGVADRLGLGYEAMKARNPRIIYASATGYGPKGEESSEPSFDHLGLARSGIMNAAGEPDMPPLAITGGVADQMGGIMMAYGIVNAIVARERFGIGQQVNASHLGSMTFLQGLGLSMKLMAGVAMPRSFRAKAANPLWNHYRCADDQWLALAMLQPDRYWKDFCRVIDHPELAEDERFVDMAARAQNSEACVAIIDAAFASRPRAEWLKRLKEDAGDFIYTVVNSVDDVPEDPQVLANDYVVEMDHPQHGPTKMVGIPVGLSETPGSVRRAAPELGQDTELVLMEVLGWDWDRIQALREKEAI